MSAGRILVGPPAGALPSGAGRQGATYAHCQLSALAASVWVIMLVHSPMAG
jgi:hypothetical protein